MRRPHTAIVVLGLLFTPAAVWPAVIDVVPGASIQVAIAGASDGDVIRVATGVYQEEIDFLGKAITVVGAGPDSVIQGDLTGSVVRFASGEGPQSVLDSFTITGGGSEFGGGIYISDSSPLIVRNVIAGNSASNRGSGIFIQNSTARIVNNLLIFNFGDAGLGVGGGDPHSIEVSNASPLIINNTIARGSSNGMLFRLASAPVVENNVIALNGSKVGRERFGRGICDFSTGGTARMRYNLFYKNRVGALLTNGTDFRRIRRAEAEIGAPRLEGNVDGGPKFQRRIPNIIAEATPFDFTLRDVGRARAIDGGNPDPAFNDRDGSRNDIGHTGGLYAGTASL